MWLFWEGEAPAEPLGLGLPCELLPVFVRRQRGGGLSGSFALPRCGWRKVSAVLNHEWTRMNAGGVIDLMYVAVLGGRGSCRAFEVGFAW